MPPRKRKGFPAAPLEYVEHELDERGNWNARVYPVQPPAAQHPPAHGGPAPAMQHPHAAPQQHEDDPPPHEDDQQQNYEEAPSPAPPPAAAPAASPAELDAQWLRSGARDTSVTWLVSADEDGRGGVFSFVHRKKRYALQGRKVGFVRFRSILLQVSRTDPSRTLLPLYLIVV